MPENALRTAREWSAAVGLFLGVLSGGLVGQAADEPLWPMFRGPNAAGLAKETTVTTWNLAKGENVLWKKVIPGLGHSSPVVAGGRVFITSAVNQHRTAPLKVGLYGDPASAADDDPQQWHLLCLDRRTGDVLWDRTAHTGVPQLKRHAKATHANCTATTDGRHVVAFFGSEGLYCYDVEGNLRWRKDWGPLRTSPMVYNDAPEPRGIDLEWGFASSPVISGDRVFVQCDVLTNGFVTALNLADGKEIWRTPRDDTATWSTPNVWAAGERAQLVVNGWKHIGGYDLQTGQEIWRMAGGGDCPVPTPVFGEDLAFFTSAHGPRRPIYAVRMGATGDISLQKGTSTNAFVAWSALKGGAYMQTPLVYGGLLYSCHDDGVLSCYEARTGRRHYQERLGSGGEGFTASPVASAGQLYFTGEQGSVFVVKPGERFEVWATNKLDEVCMATPSIAAGVLYYRTQGHLVALGSKEKAAATVPR